MSQSDRVGAAVTRRHKGIDYKRFLRCLRPELADKILNQHIARAAILERHSGATPRDAADQSDASARLVCCPDYVLGIHDDG